MLRGWRRAFLSSLSFSLSAAWGSLVFGSRGAFAVCLALRRFACGCASAGFVFPASCSPSFSRSTLEEARLPSAPTRGTTLSLPSSRRLVCVLSSRLWYHPSCLFTLRRFQPPFRDGGGLSPKSGRYGGVASAAWRLPRVSRPRLSQSDRDGSRCWGTCSFIHAFFAFGRTFFAIRALPLPRSMRQLS